MKNSLSSMTIKGIYNRIVLHRWNLGFVENSIGEILRGDDLTIKYVKYPFKGRWYADPFILDYDDEKIFLLVEDYSDSNKKGIISKLVIDRDTMKLMDVKIILELETHLSFPAILRKDGKIFIYPENSSGKGLALYEYDTNTDSCNEVRVISANPFTDAIITTYWGKQQLFSTRGEGANKNVLEVFDYHEEDDNWVKTEQVVFNENIARNAGDFFEYHGCIYRAAQECDFTYGHALSIQQITNEEGKVRMQEIRRIPAPDGALGIHTFNVYHDLVVVDTKVFRRPWIAKPLFAFRNWLSFAIKHK